MNPQLFSVTQHGHPSLLSHSCGLAAQDLARWVLGLGRCNAGSGEQDAGDVVVFGLWVHPWSPLALLVPGFNPSRGISALTLAKGRWTS